LANIARVGPVECGLVVELHVVDRRQQKERQREGVLQFRHPGHRLHAHRMHGEDRRTEPGTRKIHYVEEPPEQDRPREVEQHRREVIARRPHLEEGPLEPQGGVAQREVVGAIGVEPELGERADVIRGHVGIGRDPVLDREVGREQLVIVPEPVGREE